MLLKNGHQGGGHGIRSRSHRDVDAGRHPGDDVRIGGQQFDVSGETFDAVSNGGLRGNSFYYPVYYEPLDGFDFDRDFLVLAHPRNISLIHMSFDDQIASDVGSGIHGWGSAYSPVLYKQLVIVNASVESGSLIALDRKTGREVWNVPGMRESWNTPILVPVDGGKTELVVAILGKILGLDPDTGKRLWSCDTDIGWYMVPSLVHHDGVVYCIGGRSGGGLAVKAGGRGDVIRSHRLWTSN